jgi:hypothetical protein
MRNTMVVVLLATVAVAGGAQTRLVTEVDPAGIDSIVDISEILVPLREEVLAADEPFASQDVELLLKIGDIASSFGADDYAAEARMLAALARAGRTTEDVTVTEGLSTSLRARSFNWRRSAAVTNIVGATGAVTLGAATLFHFLSEQRYERYLASEPRDGVLYQEFRTYDLLSTIFGSTSLVTLGVGLPLAFSAPSIWPATIPTPTLRPTYTASEREEVLLDLTERRSRVVNRIQVLDRRLERRQTFTFWSIGIATVGLATSAGFFLIADQVYDQYLIAPTENEAVRLSNRVRFFDGIAIIAGIASVAGYGTAMGIELFTNDRPELERRLNNINREIVEVRLTPVIPDEEAHPPRGTEE